MSRQKTGTLSSALVATKGTAEPPEQGLDLNRSPPNAPAPAALPTPDPTTLAPTEEIVGLNFKVPESFRYSFKLWALTHRMQLNETLVAAFEALKRQKGEV